MHNSNIFSRKQLLDMWNIVNKSRIPVAKLLESLLDCEDPVDIVPIRFEDLDLGSNHTAAYKGKFSEAILTGLRSWTDADSQWSYELSTGVYLV